MASGVARWLLGQRLTTRSGAARSSVKARFGVASVMASGWVQLQKAVELMAIDKNGRDDGAPEQLRPARMQIETTVLMSSNGESRPTELVDISATGALLRRPLGWSGHVGQSWVLDMIFGNNLHIHLEAVVARISDHHIGFSYSRIPEDKQVPLWNLLGGYADILEYWKDG
jgi:hypothetical protein